MAALFLALLSIIIILLGIYLIVTRKFDYWKKRNVPYLKPHFLFGNYKDYMLLKKTPGEVAQDICRQFPNEPYIGTYYGTEPALLVQDPELIKLITAKDYTYFSGRELSKYVNREPIFRHMLNTYGDEWKVSRQNISPQFSSSKLKNMFPLILNCIRQFEDMLEYETSMSKVQEARTIMSRFTMECICSIGFGIEVNVLMKNSENNSFRKIGDSIFEISNIRVILTYFRAMWPGIFYALGFKIMPDKITNFFTQMLTNVFKSRNYKPSSRNDFVDVLLHLKKNEYLTCESIMPKTKGTKVSMKVDDDFLVANCMLFFAAGYETSATTSSVLLYRLAKDQEIQNKVVEEIEAYLRKRDGKIEYDCVTELPFLEACISESIRLHPVLGYLTREVMEPYVLPSGLKLEPGLRIHFPIYHLHMNPDYFPEPEVFKPERFFPENKNSITPCTYLPFGEGQRICLGMRVSKMQMYPGLITVLTKYRLELADNFPTTEFEPRARFMTFKNGIPLKFIPRT